MATKLISATSKATFLHKSWPSKRSMPLKITFSEKVNSSKTSKLEKWHKASK